MAQQRVSVVIVSRDRPKALLHCLLGLDQLFYQNFEVIVVADPKGATAVAGSGWADTVKLIEFDRPNISAARNLGIKAAAGEIVAFIDDDAVPEPTWLDYFVEPFQHADIAAAGGFVRGRNGITFQSRARMVNTLGNHASIEQSDDGIIYPTLKEGWAVKTEGTNCAVRRDVLCALGGFDPAFRFYLDETDLNLRLAQSGAKTALVPQAQVHHGFAASAQRHQSRMPRDLFEIGASQVVFLRKHAGPELHQPALQNMVNDQRKRLLRHMVNGTCEPRDVARVMASLAEGIDEGWQRPIGDMPKLHPANQPFQRFTPTRRFDGSTVIKGRIWSGRALRRKASRQVKDGKRVSLFLFSPTTLFHRVRLHADGYWEQRGGIFGKSDRSQPIFQYESFNSRVKKEIKRVQSFRKCGD